MLAMMYAWPIIGELGTVKSMISMTQLLIMSSGIIPGQIWDSMMFLPT